MKWFFRIFLFQVLKFILWLRYRIEVVDPKGILSSQSEGGILFLPNHPAEIDPLILTRLLWPKYQTHPIVTDKFYQQPLLRPFMDLVRAIPLPVLDTRSAWKKRKIEQAKKQILRLLTSHKNVLLYPAGKLREGGLEKIGGASLLADLLAEEPSIQIVLVRTIGLWGSLFSKAEVIESPDFVSMGKKMLSVLYKNALFFLPRRVVRVEFEQLPLYCFANLHKVDINYTLEQWYNQDGEEPIHRVPYHFIKKLDPQSQPPLIKKEEEKKSISSSSSLSFDDKQSIRLHLSKMTGIAPEAIGDATHLSHDLGLDSLEIATLCTYLEERFEQGQTRPDELKRVEDLFLAAEGKKKGEDPLLRKGSIWRVDPEGRPCVKIPEGDTLEEVFFKSCARMSKFTACGDVQGNAFSYQRLKFRVLLLSIALERKWKNEKSPHSHVGVLLPASIASYATILSLLLLGKIPVMLNWTTGEKALDKALEICPLSLIISSEKFLNRLENIDFSSVESLIYPLEELRRGFTWKMLCKAWILSLCSYKRIFKYFKHDRKKEDIATILFTSGSEGVPKAVPLSHGNLLANQRAASSCIDFLPSDIFYGILPPFHSFGFALAGLFPLLAGLKVYYAPDPTDVYGLIRDIREEGLTLLCSAPSFLQAIFKQTNTEKGSKQLSSLRLIATGAERAPPELFAQARERGITLIEGYGVTECSPVVTLERKEREPGKEGVGTPLPGISLCILDPNTSLPLELGQEGEVCISGENVFSGYVKGEIVPFILLDGITWYRSGDLGFIDTNGALVLTGRLKRFVKIGGEMVNLNILETVIKNLYKDKDFKLAIIAKGEGSGELEITLFTTEPMLKEEINRSLREEGWGRLAKIAKVQYLQELPITGTGKTDYIRLETLL